MNGSIRIYSGASAGSTAFVIWRLTSKQAYGETPQSPRPNDFAWKEVSLNRNFAAGWIGREPLFPWEAKVYVHQ
jgi:hypothetical protein